jgi:hypothetical protein
MRTVVLSKRDDGLATTSYLPRQALLHRPAQVGYPWEYERDSTDYVLTFRYTGPGMNSCHYSPAEPRWKCGGYF